MAKQEQAVVRPNVINAHVAAVYPALAMLAGMQLDLFSPLGTGALTAEELAAELDVQPERLEPLLYALVSAGLLTLENGRFANTAESDHYLVRGKRRFLGDVHKIYSDLWASTLHTAASIRTGKPQAMHDFSGMGDDELYTFLHGQDAGSAAVARKLIKDFELTSCRQHLDIGGGAGGIAVTLTRLLDALQSTIVELPAVAKVTQKFITEAKAEQRIRVVGQDAVNSDLPGVEGGYDLVTMRSLLQVLSRPQAQQVVTRAGQVTAPGGQVFIMGRVLDDSRLSPPETVAANVQFLNIYANGGAYTEGEYRTWLGTGGFENFQRFAMSGGYSLIRAVKSAS